MRFLGKENAGGRTHKIGDRVKIHPKVDVYGMMGKFVNKIGTIIKIKEIAGGYLVAEVQLDTIDRICVIQTKHLDIVKY